MAYAVADTEPTFDLPAGSSSDFYLSREINDREDDNNGKIIKKHGLWRYPFLTRRTGDSLVGTNEEITSSELRHGRTASKTKLGNASSSGSLDIEFSPETFDDQLEGVFRDKWVRWFQDGKAGLITKDYLTAKGRIHVNGDDGTYNQWYDETRAGKRVTEVPLLYNGTEAGTVEDPYGLIKVSEEKIGKRAKNPLGKFIAHELHIGNTPVKYAALSRIPITEKAVRYANYRHVEMGELNLNVTVNAIVTGSFNMNGSNNPDYYTENSEVGKTRMADQMYDKKVMAKGDGGDFYSTDYRDAAEKFISKARETTKSTETDQFTALDGFLYVNGHQLQFCSDLTMDLNNNLQAVYAIFVKNAIANLSPSLAVTGNITAYFTDGEKDATGRKYGADDLKNLASQNKDVEILYAFIDKEDPDIVYLFQIFKATISAPSETKDAESSISLELPYTSFGEMAVRCLRLEIPKIRDIEIDTQTALASIRGGTDTAEVGVTLYPNVPLDSESVKVGKDADGDSIYTDADYVDAENVNGLYVFNNAEVTVIDSNGNSAVDEGAVFSGAEINTDGSISAKLTLSNNLNEGDTVKVKVTVNGTPCEESEALEPEIAYMRMGDGYKAASYAAGAVVMNTNDTLNVFEAGSNAVMDEASLFYKLDSVVKADDLKVTSSDESVATVENGVVTMASTAEGAGATITVASKYDKNIWMEFDVKMGGPAAPEAETPVFSDTWEPTRSVTTEGMLSLDGTATVSDGGTVTYKWTVDGAEQAETGASFTVDTSTAGTYVIAVTATNTLGENTAAATQSTTVTVSD